MFYILLDNSNAATQNIPEFDPAFPDVPITERYAPWLLDRCARSETSVPAGWIYDKKSGTFTEPLEPEPEPLEPITDYVTFADLAEMLGLAAEPDSRKAIAETLSDVALVSRERKVELELEPGIIDKPIKGLST